MCGQSKDAKRFYFHRWGRPTGKAGNMAMGASRPALEQLAELPTFHASVRPNDDSVGVTNAFCPRQETGYVFESIV